jgi:hypothetical protein
MRPSKTKIGSKLGRLVRPIIEISNTFWWMGNYCAVYAIVHPDESRLKGRKIPRLKRGAKRRGRRSRRGGKKRRALVSAAPETSEPMVPQHRTGNGRRSAKLYERKISYSRTLIAYFKKLSGEMDVIKKKLRDNPYRVAKKDMKYAMPRVWKYFLTLKKLRRSWLDLARSSGDSKEFCMIRFRLLVAGIDDYREALNRGLSWRTRVKLDADYYGELQQELGQLSSNLEERPASHIYECTRCMRVTNIKWCRLCGDRVAPDNRKNRHGDRKGPPRGGTSMSNQGRKVPDSNKGRPSNR